MVRHAQGEAEQADDGADQPLGLAVGEVDTALSVRAVRMASAEYQGCPPRVVRGAARQAAIASSVNQTVKLPRCRKLTSYAGQFVTLCVCLGMWWRRSWFSLKGKAGIRGQQGSTPLRHSAPITNQPTDLCTTLRGGKPPLSRLPVDNLHSNYS